MIRKVFSLACFLGIVIVLNSCIAMKHRPNKGANAFYETFFINDSTLQYFIKPLDFTNGEKVSIDFTFRKSKNFVSRVTMNFSYLNKSKTELKSLQVVTDSASFTISDFSLLFKEKQKDEYHFRYSTTLDFESVELIFKSVDTHLRINDSLLLFPSKKCRETIALLKENLFEFELAQ